MKESVWYAETNKIYTRKKGKMNQKVTSLEQAFFFSAEVQVTFHKVKIIF